MYIHLGENTVVKSKDIIGIFDIENTSVSRFTREYLSKTGKSGKTINVSYEMPKSFVVCGDNSGEEKVYISLVSASTIRKRIENINI